MVTSSDEEEADIENISPFDYKPRMYCSSELKYPSSTYVCFLFTSHNLYVCKNNHIQLGVYYGFANFELCHVVTINICFLYDCRCVYKSPKLFIVLYESHNYIESICETKCTNMLCV